MIRGLFGSGFASRIDERHWQGGCPESWHTLKADGFDVVVLCARELQPEDGNSPSPNVDVVLAPMVDARLTREEVNSALEAARVVVAHLRSGRRVLVTCAMGINRSGLVSALVLYFRRRISGREAVQWVREQRPGALSNPSFVAFLESLPTAGVP